MSDVSKMTEEELLKTSSGWCDYPNLKGHFSFSVANALVATGHWMYKSVGAWGYIMERRV